MGGLPDLSWIGNRTDRWGMRIDLRRALSKSPVAGAGEALDVGTLMVLIEDYMQGPEKH
jgi:hypothetical protein